MKDGVYVPDFYEIYNTETKGIIFKEVQNDFRGSEKKKN